MIPARPAGLLAGVEPCSFVDGPGCRFVAFFQGCTFDCLACHNPATIPLRRVGAARWWPLPDLLDAVREQAPFLSGVTASGGECTAQLPFLRAFLAGVKADPDLAGLSTLVDTNGDAPPHAWDALAPVMDGAMVDLKCLDDATHRLLTGRGNRTVLASIRTLAALDRLHEVRLLVVPHVNDDPSVLLATADWVQAVRPGIRVVVIGFRHAGTRGLARRFAEATADDVDRAVAVLGSAGVHPVVAAGTPSGRPASAVRG